MPDQLKPATTEDKMRAVNTDGSPVDYYRTVACGIFNVSYEAVTDRQFMIAKQYSHASPFGFHRGFRFR